MGESKRLIKNTGVLALGGLATKLVSFLLLPLYTSVLTTTEYGTVDYINTIALFCVPIVSLLMDEALFRFLIDCKTDAERKRVVTSACSLLLLGCALFCILVLVVWIVFRPSNMALIVALVISGAMLQMAAAVLRGFGKTPLYALMNFLAGSASILLNVLFIAVLGWGVYGMLLATVIAQGGVSAAFLVGLRMWRYVDLKALEPSLSKRLFSYSVPLIPNKVSWNIMNMIDRLIIMNTLGAAASGVYAVAYKFPSVMDTVYGFFYQSWKESSARVLGSDEGEAIFYNRVYRALRRFMMGVVLCMTALMPLVYGVLVNGSYEEGLLYIPILLLATYYSNISGFYGGIFTAYKSTGIMGTTTVVSALLCVVLCFALIPFCGLYGASIATFASTFTVNEYRRIKVASFVELREDRRELFLTYLAVLGVFVLYYVNVLTGNLFASVGCAVVAMAFFFGMNRELVVGVILAIGRRG